MRRAVMFLMAFVVVLVCGCTSQVKHTAGPSVIMDVRDDSLQAFAPMWEQEVARRFPNSVVILCHGGGIETDRWIIQDDPNGRYGSTCEAVDKVLNDERDEYPDRTIVLLSCNPCHIILHGHPDCYYASSSVWCVPDRDYDPSNQGFMSNRPLDSDPNAPVEVQPPLRSVMDPDTVGNIYEFVSAE